MKKRHANRAILVLESPWELDAGDANRSSVLPFVEGVAKYAGDTDVFHANFYDKSSFKMALACLCKTRYSNTTVYIAAHGGKDAAGGVDLMSILVSIGMESKACNITGVLLGSCYVGQRSDWIEAGIQESSIRWCAGYASSANWLPGTMIDCAILAAVGDLEVEDFGNATSLVNCFGTALAPFSRTNVIGDDNHGRPVKLADSMQFVIQPAGQGNRAKNVSDTVFAHQKTHQ